MLLSPTRNSIAKKLTKDFSAILLLSTRNYIAEKPSGSLVR